MPDNLNILDAAEVAYTEPERPDREPALVPTKPGLHLTIDISPGQIKDSRIARVVPTIWEDTAEDIAQMLTKRLLLGDSLGVRSSAILSTNGKVTLTLSMAPDA